MSITLLAVLYAALILGVLVCAKWDSIAAWWTSLEDDEQPDDTFDLAPTRTNRTAPVGLSAVATPATETGDGGASSETGTSPEAGAVPEAGTTTASGNGTASDGSAGIPAEAPRPILLPESSATTSTNENTTTNTNDSTTSNGAH